MTLPCSYRAPQPNSITLCIRSAHQKTASSQLYGKTTNELVNKINGSVWVHVPHQLKSGITSPFCSSQAKGWYEQSAWLGLGRGGGRKSEGEVEKMVSDLWWNTPHPLLVTGLLFPSFSSARSRFLRVVVYARACVTTTAHVLNMRNTH